MKVIIPENLNEITLNQYLKFKKVIGASDITDEIYKLAMVTIFCNLKVEETRAIEFSQYNEIYNKLAEVLQQEPTFQNKFTVNGKEFGFIPNLDNITAGEYIDLDKYTASEDTFVNVMGVLFRPITNKIGQNYLIEYYDSSDKYLEFINEMPLGVALGAGVFFCNLSKDLLLASKNYLQAMTAEEVEELDLLTNGVGINPFIQLLEETSQNLTKFLTLGYMSF